MGNKVSAGLDLLPDQLSDLGIALVPWARDCNINDPLG